jgi:hypothetical protein
VGSGHSRSSTEEKRRQAAALPIGRHSCDCQRRENLRRGLGGIKASQLAGAPKPGGADGGAGGGVGAGCELCCGLWVGWYC